MLTPYQVNEDRDKVCGAALAQATRLMVNLAFLMGLPSLADGYDGGSAEQ